MKKQHITGHVSKENEYFAAEDVEKLRRLATHEKHVLEAEQQKALKQLHYMHCPNCGMKMKKVREGKVEVLACFSCGGAFLEKSDIGIIAAPQQKGIMASILNWFREETEPPVKP